MNKKLAIITVSLTVLAALLAVLVNVGIGSLLTVPEGAQEVASSIESDETLDSSRRATRSTRAVSQGRYIKDILHRNIFDHTKVGVSSSGGTSGPESQTDLDYKLVLTMVAVPASYSSALIAPKDGEGAAHGYGIGDMLEDAEIIDIQKRLVKLKRGDQTEILSMEEDKSSSRRKSTSKGDVSDDEGIEKIGENSYAVDQSIIDKYLGNLDALSKMARASPHRGPDGEIDGYRLSGVRRNTPLDKLGIKNGDVIKGVNNTSLNSISNAMGAYNSLQQESNFSFEVARRGQDLKLNYEIR